MARKSSPPLDKMERLRTYRPVTEGTQPAHLHAPYVSSQKRAPLKALVKVPQTISELTGPDFRYGVVKPREL